MSLNLLPEPRHLELAAGAFALPRQGVIAIADWSLHDLGVMAAALLPGHRIAIAVDGAPGSLELRWAADLEAQGYELTIAPAGVVIRAADLAGARHAIQTLRQIAADAADSQWPALTIRDAPAIPVRGVYYDLCRGRVPKLERLIEQAELLSLYKINELQLYIEHTFSFRRHPDIGKDASPLSPRDVLELDARCRDLGIELVPSLACFGHLASVLKHPQYHHLAEDWGVGKYHPEAEAPNRDLTAWSLAPANPDIHTFLDELFAEFLPCFSSDQFNVCCDETWDLCTGQSYELGREKGKGRVYLEHIRKLADLAAKYGKRIQFWGDIIRHYPELIDEIPDHATVLDWGYSAFMDFDRISDFKAAGKPFYACPGTSSWLCLFPQLPVAEANIHGHARAAAANAATGLLNTDWGDRGHFNFMEFSWHGYLFGAEQAWNPDADRGSFDARFARRFLGTDAPAVVNALRQLGRLATCYEGWRYISHWAAMLWAAPDDEQAFGDVTRKYIVAPDGKPREEELRLDARFAEQSLDTLEGIRGAFRDLQRRRGGDPHQVLPYWLFAIDTIACAARKLAAFGPGGKDGPSQRRALKRELQDLRERFEELWLDRNRPSEIRFTLKRYDDAIASLDQGIKDKG